MRKVILFIAMSLDGYIADRNGGVDWLKGHGRIVMTVTSQRAMISNISPGL